MPKVSIVLPTYNGEKYIQESVESIINQSFTDWELIIVDDCSTDHTAMIVDQYASEDFRIKVIHNKKNQKLPQSLNIGFGICEGEYLTWTSDDNYYKKDAIKEMYNYLHENEKISMVCADMDVIDDVGKKLYELKMFDELDVFYNNCIGACFMYKRKVLDELGGYDVDMFLVEDYAYWLKILKRYERIGYIKNILYVYRLHENSLTTQRQIQIKKQLLCLRKKNIDLILERLKEHKKIISYIYYEFLEMNEEMSSIEEKIFNRVPELAIDRITEANEREFIIWGAGNYGEKAFEYLHGKAAYFTDIDKSKIGKYKCGLKIISKERFLDLHKSYNLLIAVSYEKVYDILHFLYCYGIKNCVTYQKQIWYNRLKYTK